MLREGEMTCLSNNDVMNPTAYRPLAVAPGPGALKTAQNRASVESELRFRMAIAANLVYVFDDMGRRLTGKSDLPKGTANGACFGLETRIADGVNKE
jgi:hypothetical protein